MTALDEARDPETSAERLRFLARDAALVAAVAGNPSTPEDLLAQLATHADPSVRAAVAGNPNTPWQQIMATGGEFPARFFANPVLPLLLMEQSDLFHSLPSDVARKLLRYASFPAHYLPHFKTYPDGAVQHTAQMVGWLHAPCEQADWQSHARKALMLDDFGGDVQRGIRHLRVFHMPGMVQPWFLEHLAVNVWRGARALVARCPDTPPAILERLATDEDAEVRWALAANPHLSPDILTVLAHDWEKAVRRQVAQHPATSLHVLGQLARDPVIEVCQAVASHPRTPLIMLAELITHLPHGLNDWVARNPGLTRETHARVLELSVLAPLLAEARDPQTPPQQLRELAQSPLKDVLIALAQNPALPRDLLLTLAAYPSARVRSAVARLPHLLLDPISLQDFYDHRGEQGRAFLAEYRHTPVDMLMQLSRDKNWRVRALVARHPAMPHDAVAQLARDPATTVRQAVAERPGLSPKLLELLAGDEDDWVQRSIITRSTFRPTPAQLRSFIKRNHAYRHFVASYPTTPGDILAELLQHRPTLDVDELLLNHPNAPNEVRRQARLRLLGAKLDQLGPLSRAAALTCPDLPGEWLACQAVDGDWVARLVVACHPNIFPETLATLARDPLPLVRAAARAHQAARDDGQGASTSDECDH